MNPDDYPASYQIDGKGLNAPPPSNGSPLDPSRGTTTYDALSPDAQLPAEALGSPSEDNPAGGGGSALGPISDIIIDMNGTLYYADFNAAITGPV